MASSITAGVDLDASRQQRLKVVKEKKRYLPRIACFKATTLEDPAGGRSIELEAEFPGDRRPPTHLVVFVNGIIGSASDWRFAAKQFVKRFPEDAIVHCSESNTSRLTLDGIDVMGERLAEEVLSVTKCRPEVRKISFIGHSLGGLIARYAIGSLHSKDIVKETSEENGDCKNDENQTQCLEEKSVGKIAGLEAMNFITFATPHLGSFGHKQFSFAMFQATGYLLKYIVGWRTSSIRRQHELPKRHHFVKNDKYPHIVYVETPNTTLVQQEALSEGKLDMEEAMIRGMNKVSWERVDVNFRKSKQRYFAHTTIQAGPLAISRWTRATKDVTNYCSLE